MNKSTLDRYKKHYQDLIHVAVVSKNVGELKSNYILKSKSSYHTLCRLVKTYGFKTPTHFFEEYSKDPVMVGRLKLSSSKRQKLESILLAASVRVASHRTPKKCTATKEQTSLELDVTLDTKTVVELANTLQQVADCLVSMQENLISLPREIEGIINASNAKNKKETNIKDALYKELIKYKPSFLDKVKVLLGRYQENRPKNPGNLSRN